MTNGTAPSTGPNPHPTDNSPAQYRAGQLAEQRHQLSDPSVPPLAVDA